MPNTTTTHHTDPASDALAAAALQAKSQPFYTLISSYLLAHGYTRSATGGDDYWYHPTLGVRSFEVCVIWQLTQEHHYGDRVSGWRQIGVPVPIAP